MLNFFKYILRPALAALALVLSVPVLSLPAQAGRMIWSTVDTPGSQFYTVVSPGEVDFLARSRDGRTFYAADTSQSRLYRSDDSGVSWLEISGNLLGAGAGLPVWNLAVSPDNPQFVAAVTSSGNRPRQIFVSQDGGQTWNDTAFPVASDIAALDISPIYGVLDIAAGTRSGGAGNVYVYKAGGIGGAWAAQGFSGDVLAIRFPSSYRADPSIAVLYSTAAGTYFNAGVHDLSANTTNWDTVFSGNPPEITVSGTGTSPRAAQIVGGCLQLTADYSGQAPALCRAYLSVDAPGAGAGIFRIDDAVVYQLMASQANRRVSSIAYFGTYSSGKLLAGAVTGDVTQGNVLTWFTDTPTTCPTACWYQTEKPPTGAGGSGYGNAIVMWSPDGGRAYCATASAPLTGPGAWPGAYLTGAQLDESAFSQSKDNGKTWNQVSLIDTQISFLSDVAVKADTSMIYLATINQSGAGLDSVWRSGGSVTGKSWERVLCFPAARNDIILRMSDYGNDASIFMASRGTDDLRQSQDYGQTWKAQLPAMNVTDFSVTLINNTRYLYVISTTSIRKANVSSLTPQWSQQALVGLSGCHTIFAAPDGSVAVGGSSSDTRAAFSSGGPFNVTPYLPSAGNIHAVLDYRFSDTAVIYAAADSVDSDIYFWLTGYSRDWDIMGAPSSGFWGLAQMGTLYGASSSSAGSSVDRTLYPEALGPPNIEWDMLTTGLPAGVAFTREPVSLKLSSGVNLWAIDNRPYDYMAGTGRLWTFCDCLSPTPIYSLPGPSPAQKETAPKTSLPPQPQIPAPQTEIPVAPVPEPSENIQSPSPAVTPPSTAVSPDRPSQPAGSDNGTLNLAAILANDIYLWICLVVAVLVIVLIIVLIANSVSRRRI